MLNNVFPVNATGLHSGRPAAGAVAVAASLPGHATELHSGIDGGVGERLARQLLNSQLGQRRSDQLPCRLSVGRLLR